MIINELELNQKIIQKKGRVEFFSNGTQSNKRKREHNRSSQNSIQLKDVIMNKVRIFFIALMATGLFFACEQKTDLLDDGSMEDQDLISAIESASKKTISAESLPNSAIDVLATDYSDSYVDLAQMAPELGYAVKMRISEGAGIGEVTKVYFKINGKKLTGKGEKGNPKHDKKPRKECFALVLPVSFIMPDGSTISVEDKEGFKQIKEWFKANPEAEGKPELQFPVEIAFADGTTQEIASEEEIKAARETCKEKRQRCFKFVFPVTMVMPDGTEIVGNNRDEFKAAIKDWHTANPDAEEKGTLKFPVNITFPDESQMTIESAEEMKALKEKCREDGKGRKGPKGKKCFKLVFPVTFVMPDASTITANDKEELKTSLDSWYQANPDAKEKAVPQFPVEIIYEDGNTMAINSKEEMRAAKDACKSDKEPKGKKCFGFVFPVTFTMPDESTITANDREELKTALQNWHQANPDVKEKAVPQFPVEIVYEDGNTSTINSEEELRAAKVACKGEKHKGKGGKGEKGHGKRG